MDPQATRQTKFGVDLFGFCTKCNDAKTENVARLCRGCYHESRRGGSFAGTRDRGGARRLQKLNSEERRVFDVIMRKKRWTAETRNEALGIVQRAVQRGRLTEEFEYWTTPYASEPVHKTTSLGLAAVYAPGAIW